VNSVFQSSASLWWLPAIIAFGVGVVYVLYFYKANKTGLSKFQLFLLASVRFLTIFIIGILLLIPVIKTLNHRVEKSIIVLITDQSKSLVLTKDSNYYRNSYPKQVDQMVHALGSQFEVKTIQFGEQTDSLAWGFNQTETNFENLFSLFINQSIQGNIGALIIASDGIVNRGISPIYAASNLAFPIYTLALGDTQSVKGMAIRQIEYNKVTFKGNRFPVAVSVSANDMLGENIEVEIYHNHNKLNTQALPVDSKNYFKKLNFQLDADSTGINDYSVRLLSKNSLDANPANNEQHFYIEVNENQKKILLLYNGQHPDISVFQHHIESNQAYRLEKFEASRFADAIVKYDLIILYQLPSKANYLDNLLPQIKKVEKPILFVIGQQTSVMAFNNLKTALQIGQNKELYNEVVPLFNKNFNLFHATFENSSFENFPPLQVPFGSFNEVPAGSCLFYQKIERINTSNPLWFFAESDNIRYGFIAGEGLWKWYLTEYFQNSNHAITNELVLKTIQYLTSNNRKEPLVIEIPLVMDQQKPILFNAKLYNASDELINDPDLLIDVLDEKGNVYPYQFQKSEETYFINIGNLPVGIYKFQARVRLGDELLKREGKFIVQESMIEHNGLVADHQLLYTLANEHSGQMYFPNQWNKLTENILKNNQIKPKIISERQFIDLIQFKWIFIVLLSLLSLEWFLRKYWGTI